MDNTIEHYESYHDAGRWLNAVFELVCEGGILKVRKIATYPNYVEEAFFELKDIRSNGLVIPREVDRPKLTRLNSPKIVKPCRTKFVLSTKRIATRNEYDKKLRKLEDIRRRERHSFKEQSLFSAYNGWDQDKIVDMIEDFSMLGYELYRSRTVMDTIMATASFLKRRNHGPLLRKSMRDRVTKFIKQTFGSDEYSEQGDFEEHIRDMRSNLDLWPRIRSSPIWRKISKILVFTAGMSMFGSDINLKRAIKVEEAYYTNRHMFVTDFTHALLDLLLFIAERGYQIFKTGRIDVMFHSGTAYERWYEESTDVIAKSRFIANPEAHGIDLHTFSGDLDRLIAQGISMNKYACELDKSARGIIRGILSQLQIVRSTHMNKRQAQKTRAAPFPLLVEGHSSIGKSTFSEMIHYYYGVIHGKDVSPGSRYTKNPLSEYWDGFSSNQWSLLLDDVGFLKPGSSKEVDPTLKEAIQILNNTPYIPNMAALEDKGSAPLKVELVVATTNTPDLNLHSYFAVPLAVARRFPYHVRLAPKPEFSQDDKNSMMLDSNKMNPSLPGTYPDVWLIEIYEPVPEALGQDKKDEFKMTARLERTHAFGSLKEFLPWLHGAFKKHAEVQRKITRSGEDFQQTRICLECSLPELDCRCDEQVLVKPLIREQGAFVAYTSWIIFLMACHHTIRNGTDWIFSVLGRWLFFSLAYDRIILACIQYTFWDWPIELWTQAHGYTAELAIRMRHFGERVQRHLSTPKVCAAVATAVAAAVAAYKLHSYMNRDLFAEQGISDDLGMRPKEKNERESVWYCDNYVVDDYDVGRTSKSWKALPTSDVERILSNNCVYLTFDNGTTGYSSARAIGIGGQYYLVNNHIVPNVSEMKVQMVRRDSSQQINSNIKFVLYEKDIIRDVERDLAVIRIRYAPPVKDIRDLFIREKALSFRGTGFYLKRSPQGNVERQIVSGIKRADFPKGLTVRNGIMGISGPTESGDCGSILVCQSKMGPVIAGLHYASQEGRKGDGLVCVAPVTYEWIQEYVPEFVVSTGEVLLDAEDAKIGEPGELNKKSPFRFIDDGTANVFGSLNNFRVQPRSKVRPTILCDYIKAQGEPLNYGAPVMKGYRPWRRAALSLTKLNSAIDTGVLDVCTDSLLQDWISGTPQKWKDEIQIYDNFTVVNGAPGTRYVDKINRKTSAGSPWCKSKKFLITPIEPIHGVDDPVAFDKSVMDRVDARTEMYLNCERTHPIFRASLKDEARTHQKIEDAKTRVFMGAPVDFTIVMRKFLLSFVRVAQKNKYTFESAPGAEAQSIEWDWFYQYLTQHGESRCVFGDFSDFDITMSPAFILAAFDAIARFHEHCGASEEHVRVIRTLSYDIAFAWVDFNGDLVEFFGKNPSGQALTVIINGIVNCLYMRYAYHQSNPKHEVDSFKRNVNLLTYGDDNGMNVSPEAPWFNHTSIKDKLAVINVKYTMADKDTESVPYINIAEGSFLKRRWRFEDDLGTYVCPLERDSIIKSLMIGPQSGFNSDEVQGATLIFSSVYEWFWHGRETFERERARSVRMLDDLGLEIYLPAPLPSWGDLCEWYRQNSTAFLNENTPPPFVTRFTLQGDTQSYCANCRDASCSFGACLPMCRVRLCLKCGRCTDPRSKTCLWGCHDLCEVCHCRHISVRLRNQWSGMHYACAPCTRLYQSGVAVSPDRELICDMCGEMDGEHRVKLYPKLEHVESDRIYVPEYCAPCAQCVSALPQPPGSVLSWRELRTQMNTRRRVIRDQASTLV